MKKKQPTVGLTVVAPELTIDTPDTKSNGEGWTPADIRAVQNIAQEWFGANFVDKVFPTLQGDADIAFVTLPLTIEHTDGLALVLLVHDNDGEDSTDLISMIINPLICTQAELNDVIAVLTSHETLTVERIKTDGQ